MRARARGRGGSASRAGARAADGAVSWAYLDGEVTASVAGSTAAAFGELAYRGRDQSPSAPLSRPPCRECECHGEIPLSLPMTAPFHNPLALGLVPPRSWGGYFRQALE
jgi:hypothetical protein